MKRIISMFLVLVLLFLCGPIQTNAIFPGEDSVGSTTNPPTGSSDDLIKLRAQLMMYPNPPQEQIDSIDEQLLALGVEKISAADVLNKLSSSAQPLFDIESTDDTEWFSERSIVVVQGRQYEVQVITGMWQNSNSPLNNFTAGASVHRQYSGELVGLVNALQVLGDEIVTGTISEKLPVLGDYISVAKTLYEVINAYYEGLTPTSVVEDATYGYSIIIGTTVRIVFVKGMGSPDSMQSLCYSGNHVNYIVQINIPLFSIINGEQVMDIQNDDYPDTATSYAFDTSECKTFSANNYRLKKEGRTDVDIHQEIYKIPMILLDERYVADVPIYLPY